MSLPRTRVPPVLPAPVVAVAPPVLAVVAVAPPVLEVGEVVPPVPVVAVAAPAPVVAVAALVLVAVELVLLPPQAASRALMAGALKPRATARLSTSRRESREA